VTTAEALVETAPDADPLAAHTKGPPTEPTVIDPDASVETDPIQPVTTVADTDTVATVTVTVMGVTKMREDPPEDIVMQDLALARRENHAVLLHVH
jgi:hypothetical protein